MRSAYSSTVLALLFGLGVAVSGVPASAEQAAGQAGGKSQEQLAAGQQTGGQTATGGQAGTGQMTTGGAAGQTGATAGQAGTEAGQTGATTAAGTGTGTGMDDGEYVTGEQAATRSEERWSEMTGGAEHMTQDQFGAGMTGSQDVQASFSEVDEDGDGQISREEWMNWREQGFAGATQGSEGRMSSQDFETWDTGGEVTSQ